MNQWSKLVLGAVMAGFLSSPVVMAEGDAAAPTGDAAKAAETTTTTTTETKAETKADKKCGKGMKKHKKGASCNKCGKGKKKTEETKTE